MKFLLKTVVVLTLLFLLLLGGLYFLVTNPNFQRSQIVKRLPEGSTLEAVKIGLKQVELEGLSLALADGSTVKVSKLNTDIDPLAAAFDKTIRVGELAIDGVRVELSRVIIPTEAEAAVPQQTAGSLSEEPGPPPSAAVKTDSKPSGDPLDPLYAIGELAWLFDVERIAIKGTLVDGAGSLFEFSFTSTPIAPGGSSTIKTALVSVFSEAIQGGLKRFEAAAELGFQQRATGGFGEFTLSSKITAIDANGTALLDVVQSLGLELAETGQQASVIVDFDASMPRPSLFFPELATIGPIEAAGTATVRTEGQTLEIVGADLEAKAGGATFAKLDLKQPLKIGGENPEGELLNLSLVNVPVEWAGPFLPEGLFVDADPISLSETISGMPDGGLRIESNDVVRIGNLSVSNADGPLVRELTIQTQPFITIRKDGGVDFDLGDLSIEDQYGSIVEGSLNGTLEPELGPESHFTEDLKVSAKLQVELQPLLQQPALAGKTSIMSGSLRLDATIDGSKEYPIQAQGSLRGLRTRAYPGTAKDYRLAAQAKREGSSAWLIGANLISGNIERSSTSIRVSGGVDPETSPLRFKVDLVSEKITQSDLTLLTSAFEEGSTPRTTEFRSNVPGRPATPTARSESVVVSSSPPWALLDGTAKIDVERLVLDSGRAIEGLKANAKVSEPLLELRDLQARVDGGQLTGATTVRYDETKAAAYAIDSDLTVTNVDPSVFAASPGSSFPVRGLFDARLLLKGAGPSMETAIDNSDASVKVSGRDGVLTAFELDNTAAVGIGIVGLLGQKYERPGLAALTKTIPYFKDIVFSSLDLDLSRTRAGGISISKFEVIGESLLFDGTGRIAASSLKDVMKQPMQMKLLLGAKGQLTEHLDVLGLVQEEPEEDGFTRWNREIRIGGTLERPDTGDLMKILRDASTRALAKPSPPPQDTAEGETPSSTPTSQQQEKPRERSDLDIGLDLLNTVLGE